MPETASRPYIEFREVSKAFGEKPVLDRVSFEVMPGQTVCILGRSGVGKSVSLQILMGFLKADSGTDPAVCLASLGTPIRSWSFIVTALSLDGNLWRPGTILRRALIAIGSIAIF